MKSDKTKSSEATGGPSKPEELKVAQPTAEATTTDKVEEPAAETQETLEDKGGEAPQVNATNHATAFDVVGFLKSRRLEIDTLINSAKALSGSREVALIVTNLQRSKMWLGKVLGELNTDNPYPESSNPESAVIEPQADHTGDVLPWDGLDHVARVKSLRQYAEETVIQLKLEDEKITRETPSSPNWYKGIYYIHSILALEEAKMWGGMELDRVREATK